MKRSEINGLQKDALAFSRAHNFSLPAWATWRPEDWRRVGPDGFEIKRRNLGWDITDFNNFWRGGQCSIN